MELHETTPADETRRYQVGECVGQGGLGSVYRAWDAQLGRWVAIKRLLVDPTLCEEDTRRKMRREATTLASLQHPNIVTVHDFGVDERGPFVVMEFVEGQTLDACVENAPFDGASFLELAQQTLAGVAAAHRAGLLHRDLKPGNIMLTAFLEGTFQVKVLDFGLAKFTAQPLEQTTDQTNSLLGSIYFMAPEQFRREPLDARTDLYALGCVFYYTLTGQHPFAGESVAETMASHLQHIVSDLHQHRPDLPAPLAEWVMSLLRLAPADRPTDAVEALNGLRAAARLGVAHGGEGVRERRRPLFLWLGGLCLLVLSAGLGGYVLWHHPAPVGQTRAALLPLVSLFANVPVAHAQGKVPGCFTIVRSGDQSVPVTVMYSIHGSAKNGVDYESIETIRTIKAGETSEKVVIVPIDTGDRTREDRHVRLTLLAESGYTIATPNEVKLKIVYDH